MADERPVRMCDSCGGVDDHPRHVYTVFPGEGETSPEIAATAMSNAGEHGAEVMAQIMDTGVVMKHMDCCREDGCPENICDMVTLGAEDLRGADLLNHITGE